MFSKWKQKWLDSLFARGCSKAHKSVAETSKRFSLGLTKQGSLGEEEHLDEQTSAFARQWNANIADPAAGFAEGFIKPRALVAEGGQAKDRYTVEVVKFP